MGNKRQYGECRCCLVKGTHRSLVNDEEINGKIIRFQDYFLECFNIFLSTNSNLSTLICDSCVRHLREARSFRSLVLKTERQLLNAQGDDNETEFVNVLLQPNLNIEEVPVFIKQEEDACNYSTSSPAADYEPCDLDSQSLVAGERELLARFSSRSLRRLPTRESLFDLCPVFYGHLDSLKGKHVDGNAIRALTEAKEPDRKNKRNKHVHGAGVAISEKLAQAMNATTLLENSNATAFKNKMRSGFPCFYCREIFVNPKKLREHQTIHPKSHLFKLLTKYTVDSLIVYADITDLQCNICNKDIYNLDDLKLHLTDVHAKKYYDNYPNRVIPFKLDDKENNFECQLCSRSFETFGATDRHMNQHFNNYVCEECGSGFITKHRLKVHTYMLHNKNLGIIKCEPCKKIFSSKYKYRIHIEYVHKKLKKMQCIQCSERFVDYFTRQRHMEETHGVELLSYKCTQCDRAFNRKYSLTCHIRRIHLARKDVQCELCPFMCFNKSELTDHMVKHGGEKIFECTYCQKSFARKKTLKVHLRVHSEERRYSCHLCGEAFVHNTGLKSHLKIHDDDYI